MRRTHITYYRLLFLLVLLSHKPFAQQTQVNLPTQDSQSEDFLLTQNTLYKGYYFVILEFNAIPSRNTLQTFNKLEIQLIKYLDEYKYLAKVPKNINTQKLERLNIQSIEIPSSEMKLSKEIKENDFPDWSRHGNDKIDIAILFNSPFTEEEWRIFQEENNIKLLNTLNKKGTIRTIRVKSTQIETLANHPNIQGIEPIEPMVEALNYENNQLQRTNILQSTAISGRNLKGKGVTIGVGDGGELGNHIDLNCRIINHADGTYSSYGAHGDNVSGTIGGAGNLDPLQKGIAPKSDLVIQKTTNIIYNCEKYVEDHEMVITNNSYGVGADCESNGSYNYSSINLDMQLRENPSLIHLFAAGNSGNDICNDYPPGYKTVLRYYGSAKNVLTIGAIDHNREIANMSSRGPVADGRIKPEICGLGVDVTSTGRNYNYFEISGTSMATPSVAGTMALLYERYRQLNNGINPKGALIKAISCNTADDVGNKGPDYTYGFGIINAKRAVETMEEIRYIESDIAHAEIHSHTVIVPEGVAQLKVMLYWHDKEAQLESNQVLVNDLDLKVIAPDEMITYPWVLDPSPENVTETGAEGFDRLNNIEQVTINNPIGGEYTFQIRGYQIPMGVQDYIITYDFIQAEVELTYPFGEETLIPGTTELIQWDVVSTNEVPFRLEYSADAGLSWDTIANDIPASYRQFEWRVPEEMTENGIIRIVMQGTANFSVNTTSFNILQVPHNLNVESPCIDVVELHWNQTQDAHSYEVFVLECNEMVSIGTTTDTTFLVTYEFEEDIRYWYSVRAISEAGNPSQRTIAEYCYVNTEMSCESNEVSTAIEDVSSTSIQVFPNPFSDNIRVELEYPIAEEGRLSIRDMMGREVVSKAAINQLNTNSYEFKIGNQIPPGVYYLSVVVHEKSYTVPIVKL